MRLPILGDMTYIVPSSPVQSISFLSRLCGIFLSVLDFLGLTWASGTTISNLLRWDLLVLASAPAVRISLRFQQDPSSNETQASHIFNFRAAIGASFSLILVTGEKPAPCVLQALLAYTNQMPVWLPLPEFRRIWTRIQETNDLILLLVHKDHGNVPLRGISEPDGPLRQYREALLQANSTRISAK